MALSEEQQEWLAAQSADLVARMTGLVERHRELVADSAGVRPRVPVSRAAGADPPVWRLLDHAGSPYIAAAAAAHIILECDLGHAVNGHAAPFVATVALSLIKSSSPGGPQGPQQR